jgi:hypothetical protein
MTFADGILAGHDSVKGFKVVATDGNCGRVSWASYAPGESYLVVTVGRLSRKHHVVPAAAVTGVGEGEVRLALSRPEIKRLPDLEKPHMPLGAVTGEQLVAAMEAAWARTATGGM